MMECIAEGSTKSSSSTNSIDNDHESDSSVLDRSETTYNKSTRSNTENNSSNEKSGSGESLSRKETRQVDRIRNIVILILLLSAAGIAITVYYLTMNAQTEQFNTQYDGSSMKILKSFETVIDSIGSVYSVGVAATIDGIIKNSNDTAWPFVTLQSFEQRAASARALSKVLSISIQPIITDQYRNEWEQYVLSDANEWIEDGILFEQEMGIDQFDNNDNTPFDEVTLKNIYNTSYPIFYNDLNNGTQKVLSSTYSGPYLPRWQTSPILKRDQVNIDLFKQKEYGYAIEKSMNMGKAVFGSYEVGPPGNINSTNITTSWIATLRSMEEKQNIEYLGAPVSRLFLPIFNTLDHNVNRTVVGMMMNIIHWRSYFFNILPNNINGLVVVMENTCYGSVTFDISGPIAITRVLADGHDPKYSTYRKTASLNSSLTITDGTKNGLQLDSSGCLYNVNVYPSQTFSDDYITPLPFLITFAVSMVFIFTICLFILYNRLVEKRQSLVLTKAVHSTAIVTSLFPKQIRDQLMQQQQQKHDDNNEQQQLLGGGKFKKNNRNSKSSQIKSFFPTTDGEDIIKHRHIADLYPFCTVLFADIAGFTAWSSTRGPEQVFSLLQTVYHGFDLLAKRYRIFKVETIGDCYVAATGLPEPQSNHAILMARFARECQLKMTELTRQLEITLGPDCSDLKMRIGMHSGPVTAGVLQGDRARFQLFGDTVNTAARMESTGVKDKIHMSKFTADLLIAAGKENWIKQREEMVEAKGKGMLQTFFLTKGSGKRSSIDTMSNTGSNSAGEMESEKADVEVESSDLEVESSDLVRRERLVDWMTELLLQRVKAIVANCRIGAGNINVFYEPPLGTICLDEIQEVIGITRFDLNFTPKAIDTKEVKDVLESISTDLKSYVRQIAVMYNDNPFHSFEHACHVTMSVNKLLNRIVSPEISEEDRKEMNEMQESLEGHLHYTTYGINSDPIVQFAVVLGALIHDIDHRGCSNTQLVQEAPHMGVKYKNKSVAEQNSLDIAWNTLMSDEFYKLRKEIFWNINNLMRFRKNLVNIVLATDIFDKELNDLRKKRWEKAFSSGSSYAHLSSDERKSIANEHIRQSYENEYPMIDWTTCEKWNQKLFIEDMKATIVMEYIIQASDVAHTMQHWQIYQKWNRKLLAEMYQAYKAGRMAVDPSSFWYEGELRFFDNYVIPLTNKLRECGVFGVSSDEYFNYAVNNRVEWEQRGQSIVEEFVASYGDDMAVEDLLAVSSKGI